jgi:hypothetical protein
MLNPDIGTNGTGSKCTLSPGTLVRMVLGVNVRCESTDFCYDWYWE